MQIRLPKGGNRTRMKRFSTNNNLPYWTATCFETKAEIAFFKNGNLSAVDSLLKISLEIFSDLNRVDKKMSILNLMMFSIILGI